MRQGFDDLDRSVDDDAGTNDSDHDAGLQSDPRLLLLLQQVDVIVERADQDVLQRITTRLFDDCWRDLRAQTVRSYERGDNGRHDYALAIREYRVALRLDLGASCAVVSVLRDQLLRLYAGRLVGLGNGDLDRLNPLGARDDFLI
jgi:hypothetical protein